MSLRILERTKGYSGSAVAGKPDLAAVTRLWQRRVGTQIEIEDAEQSANCQDPDEFADALATIGVKRVTLDALDQTLELALVRDVSDFVDANLPLRRAAALDVKAKAEQELTASTARFIELFAAAMQELHRQDAWMVRRLYVDLLSVFYRLEMYAIAEDVKARMAALPPRDVVGVEDANRECDRWTNEGAVLLVREALEKIGIPDDSPHYTATLAAVRQPGMTSA